MKTDLLYSPRLHKGDLVRLVSPASYPEQAHVQDYIRILEQWGLRCDAADHVLAKHGYMAGSDTQRLDDLNKAYRDPEVRAVITTRGGAGAYRIADDIDFSAIRSDPKPLVGFSDITSLHLSLINHCHVGGIHGCLSGNAATRSVKQLLMTTDPITLKRDPDAVSAPVEFPGSAQGQLIGGNLQMLATSTGVRIPPMHGAIVFLEYHRAGLGTIDRYLTQLWHSGALNGIAGVALGSFECARNHIDRGWTVIDVLNDRLGQLGVPVLGGLCAGHDLTDKQGNHDQYAIPLGSLASLDVGEGTLTVETVMS